MRTPSRPLVIAALAAAITPFSARADDTYIGHLTFWSNPAAWSNNAPPTPTDNVFITPSLDPSEIESLTLDTTATIANLTVGAASNGAAVLNLNANSLTATSTTITSTGQIVGTGALSSPINNAGTIVASAGLLTVDLSNAQSTSFNAGTLTAFPGANLLLKSIYLYIPTIGLLDNTSGTISALGAPADTSPTTFVDLNSIAINGGEILTNAGGQVRIKAQSFISNATISGNFLLQDVLTLSNDTIAGNITKSNFGTLALGGHITNNATISPMLLNLVSSITLDGTGTINTTGTTAQSPLSLTIAQSQTIQGVNTLGGSKLTALTNSGTISATSAFNPLSLSAAANATISNNGTLQAINGGRLNITSLAPINNANGLISATGPASFVSIVSTSISGGQLASDPAATLALNAVALSNLTMTGNVVLSASSAFSNVTLSQSVTLSGNGALSGSIINNANTTIPAGANITITFNQPLQLSGTGTLSLNGGNLTQVGNATLSILPGQSLQGYGQLTLLSNAGNISANVASQSLFVNLASPSVVLSSTGNFAATAGGKLFLDSLCQISGGTISATGGAVAAPSKISIGLQSPASSITGTQLFTDSIGQISVGNATLSNDTLTGNFSFISGGLLQNSTLSDSVSSTGTAVISGTITNNATWSLSSLRISSSANLTGTGTILLTSSLNSATNTATTLNIGSSQTIKASGKINSVFPSNGVTINNAGTITTDSGLFILLFLPSTNSGTLSATNNGTLQLSGAPNASLDNTNGTLLANGGNISLSNLSLTGGQLLSAPANTITFSNNITLNGNISANATLLGAANLALTLAPTAALNLLHGALILQITDPSTLPTIQSEIAAGASHTTGLFTTTPNLALALIDNSSLATPFTTFANQPVSPNSLLITPALPGDTNLDNKVDLADLSTLLSHFGQPTPNWSDGNFDHSPTINLTDLAYLLNNFGQTTPNASAFPQLPMTNGQLPATPTPEPATLSLLALPLLLHRRRRT